MPSDPDILLQSVPADGSSIGNLKLRRQLGWGEKRYASARDALVEVGRLSTGRGRGGSVRLAKPAKTALVLQTAAENHGKLWKSLMRAHLGNYERAEARLRQIAGKGSLA